MYSELYPANQVVATISSFEGGVEFEGGEVTPPAGEGDAEGAEEAMAVLAEGLREHMGAAHAEAMLRLRNAASNMCNMLEETTQGEVVEREWAEMGVTVWRPDGRWPFCTPVASVPRWGRNGR